ncbi:Short-chain dehydrogenase/reductase SDR [uncultured Pleomorphomonas sp.]|uniref:Short-chain dehydrogenase/reductase SDR n=1 Tax=uncultured Pleomorphomonas sp. TaxID=442121 RepID=A0A212L9G6_9HYPH|nr:SDR family oxidoreductase [uncultured Pleomorphomonas sp.]SCM73979.1 Short-chain dehydrogenase/reductase SDR [uncultured Pleomorphomonas sp.]
MANLEGTVAVVTGAGRGIGREIALHQARAGARVAALARTAREIEETAALIAAEGGKAIAVPVDLVDRAAVEAAVARVSAELGPVDTLVNNHGSFRAFGPIWDCDPDTWWGDIEINLRGTFHTCRAVAPLLRARGRGRIVNLVGGGTGTSFPNGSGYAASKAAIMRFTECLDDTVKDAGVHAFAVDPGLVRTAMTELQLYSDEGRKHLPGIERLFDEGVDIPPDRAAALIADIAAGRFDKLAGRMLRGVEDRDALERAMDDLLATDGRALRLTRLDI